MGIEMISRNFEKVDERLFSFGSQITIIRGSQEGFPINHVTSNVEWILGYSKSELEGSRKSFINILSPKDVLLFEKKMAQIKSRVEAQIAGGIEPGEVVASSETEYRVINASGEMVWLLDVTGAFVDEESDEIYYKSYLTDITKYKEKEESLTLRCNEMELQNKHKSQFLANMSHDIRTPMNGMMGFLEVLYRTNLTSEQANYVDEARDACEILLSLVNDILDLSKIESFKLDIEHTDFNLKDAINTVLGVHEIRAENKGIDFKSEFDDGLPEFVAGDASRLKQILNNLLSNAIKFTNVGLVNLNVGCKTTNDGQIIIISVKDTGIGISEGEMKTLYDPYSQATPSTARLYGGTGLGLSITKSLVDLMGGEIRVESKKGVGTTFTVEILFDKSEGIINEDEYYEGVEIDPDMKVLLAEDNLMNQRLIRTMLLEKGVECDFADNGSIAYEMAKKNKYDLILMDCQMPVMDGYESTILIRRYEGKENYTPIVAMTANAMKGDRIKATSCGMDDYITKPIDFEEFYSILYKYSKHKRKLEIQNISQLKAEEKDQGDNLKASGEGFREKYADRLAKSTGIDLEDTLALMDSYIKYLPGIVISIEDALEGGRIDELMALAHQLIGSSGNYQIAELSDMARELEQKAKEGNTLSCIGIIESINEFIKRF